MSIITKIKNSIFPKHSALKETEAETAYDVWAKNYDAQPDNLVLALDESLFSYFADKINFHNKTVVDIGCGTGRHWQNMLSKNPAKLIGFDVSKGMLQQLKHKFPAAEVHQITSSLLPELHDASCDIIISTLTIAHIDDFSSVFTEWNRVLENNGSVIITDYHPSLLQKGGKRTFNHEGKTIAVKSNVYPIEEIATLARSLQFTVSEIKEVLIDDTMKNYYEKQNALHVFDKFKGTPVIYGMLLNKTNAAS